MSKTIVLLSGGLDSASLAAYLKANGHEVYALSVNYGQRHRRELQAAAKFARALQIPHEVLNMSGLAASVFAGSSQTSADIPVPHGHYEDASMRTTVVPNRNMVLLSLAIAKAISVSPEEPADVAIANHFGDHAIYPDCRMEFISTMDVAAGLCHYKPVNIVATFTDIRKEDALGLGYESLRKLGYSATRATNMLSSTWSCYEGGAAHCGKCGTCQERIEAFQKAIAVRGRRGLHDRTKYAVPAPSAE